MCRHQPQLTGQHPPNKLANLAPATATILCWWLAACDGLIHTHLQQLRLPGVQSQGPHLGAVDTQAPGR